MEQRLLDQVRAFGSSSFGSAVGNGAGGHDMSLFGLVAHADAVVKVVIFGLVFASIWTWAVIFQKYFKLKRLKRKAIYFEDRFWSGSSLNALFERVGKASDPMTTVFSVAMKEWKNAVDKGQLTTPAMRNNLLARIDRVVSVTIGRELSKIERNMTWLASVGSVSPFVGLFGTVWGIMNSFTSIANAQNTSLAVVAPGIAEALFATAIGLVSAIPAVLAYNKFNSEINRYAERLDSFGGDLYSTMSRNLEDL